MNSFREADIIPGEDRIDLITAYVHCRKCTDDFAQAGTPTYAATGTALEKDRKCQMDLYKIFM